MDDKKRIPAIRFKGFTDSWEQRKVGDYYEFKNGLNKGKEYFGEGTPIVNFTDVFHNRGISPKMLSGRVRLEPFEIKNFEVRKGDIFFTRTSETIEEIGYPSVMLGEPKNTVFSGFVLRGRCFLNVDPLNDLFKKYLFFTDTFRTEMVRKSSMTTRALTSGTAIRNMKFLHPSSKEEQHRIGEFLTNLDNLITLHQRKLESLKKMKKALLEKMFPRDGENMPSIRFKGFTDSWEQRKFFELYEKVSRKNDLTYGINDIISVANMHFKPDSYITDDSYLLTYNIFELGNIAFEGNKSKNYAHGRFVENTIGNGIVSHVFDVFKPIMNPYDLLFWKYAINNERLMGSILLRSTKASTMMTNLVAVEFLQESFLVPAYSEQKKIGTFLQQLDHLITLHQRKLEKLKNIKKAMLEKMFV